MRVVYYIDMHGPTRAVIERGDAISSSLGVYDATAALGLKLILPDGRQANTVPTHVFVKLNTINTEVYLLFADCFVWMEDALSHLWDTGSAIEGPAAGTMEESSDKSPIGKTVWLARRDDTLVSIFQGIGLHLLIWESDGAFVRREANNPPLSRSAPYSYGLQNPFYV